MVSETKRLKNIQKINKKKQAQSPKGRLKRVTATLVSVFLACLAIMGAYYTLCPKISVTPSPLLESSNPFSAPFIVKNEGNLSLYSVSYRLSSFKMRSIGNAKVNIPNGVDYSEKPLINILNSGEPTTISLPDLSFFKFQEQIANIDVVFVIMYRPAFWPLKTEKHFRFGLSKHPKSWTWLPRSMSE